MEGSPSQTGHGFACGRRKKCRKGELLLNGFRSLQLILNRSLALVFIPPQKRFLYSPT